MENKIYFVPVIENRIYWEFAKLDLETCKDAVNRFIEKRNKKGLNSRDKSITKANIVRAEISFSEPNIIK